MIRFVLVRHCTQSVCIRLFLEAITRASVDPCPGKEKFNMDVIEGV